MKGFDMRENPLGSQRSMAYKENITMRYRPPTQLHASLYMRDKKRSAGSKVSEEAQTAKSTSNKKADRTKK